MTYRNRIREYRVMRAGDLLPNPGNFRDHPDPQLRALQGSLSEVGHVDALVAFETPTGLMLSDGHARKLLEADPDSLVPVLVTDLTADEADKALAVKHPIADLAKPDPVKLHALLTKVQGSTPGLKDLLASLASQADSRPALKLPEPAAGDGVNLSQPSANESAASEPEPKREPSVFPVPIILDLEGIRRWKTLKSELGERNDTKALLLLMDRVGEL